MAGPAPGCGLIGGIPDLCNDIGRVTFDDAGTSRMQISGNQDATGDYAFRITAG